MSKGYTSDPSHHDAASRNQTFLVFSRQNNLLGNHPILAGRDGFERISQIVTFTAQSLRGPETGVALLRLSPTAADMTADGSGARFKQQSPSSGSGVVPSKRRAGPRVNRGPYD